MRHFEYNFDLVAGFLYGGVWYSGSVRRFIRLKFDSPVQLSLALGLVALPGLARSSGYLRGVYDLIDDDDDR